MRILYLTQYFNLPDQAGASRHYQFARAWTEAGHEVELPAFLIDRTEVRVVDYAECFISCECSERRLEGYSIDDAARILGCATGTVKSRCSRGRARLAVLLQHLKEVN